MSSMVVMNKSNSKRDKQLIKIDELDQTIGDFLSNRFSEKIDDIKVSKDGMTITDPGTPINVVNYNIKGHYHAHYDSSGINKPVPCCDKVRKQNCRICRYMTILFYLNDVEEGGETAFPLANNETVDLQKVIRQELFNLNKKCGSPGISVKAETGKAIIWYNHFIDPESGWLGEQDVHTYHGGCPVRKGEKWVANFWIKVTDDKKTDLALMHKYHKNQIKDIGKKERDEL